MINTAEFRDLIRDVAQEEIGDKTRYKIGEIASVGDKVQVKFSGEETASLKEYTYLKSYYPVVGDRVLLARYSGTYVVLGKINRDIREPFYTGRDLQVGGDVYIKDTLAGHIVESGSNNNGYYVKFSDGYQICGSKVTLSTGSSSPGTWALLPVTLAKPFVEQPIPVAVGYGDANTMVTCTGFDSNSGIICYSRNGQLSANTNYHARYIAFGR